MSRADDNRASMVLELSRTDDVPSIQFECAFMVAVHGEQSFESKDPNAVLAAGLVALVKGDVIGDGQLLAVVDAIEELRQ